MTIRTIEDLDAAVQAGAGVRGVSAGLLQDILDSVKGVGGIMYANDVTLPITTGWVPVDVFQGSRDTRGLTEDLATAMFTVGAGAGGPYALDVSFGVESTASGWIEIGLSKNGAAPFTKKRRGIEAGNIGAFDISDGISLDDGDTIQLAIRGSGNAPTQVTLIDGTFRVLRV